MLFCDYQAHFTKTRCKVRSLSRPPVKRMRVDSEGQSRSMSRPPRDEMGIKDSVVSISEYCKVCYSFLTSAKRIAVCCHKMFSVSFLLVLDKTVIPENRSQGRVVTEGLLLPDFFFFFFFLAACTCMAYPQSARL